MSESDNPPDHLRALSFGAAYLLVSILFLVVIPPENWSDRWPRFEVLVRSWTSAPTWHDGDRWLTNFVGHPIMGALLYSFARHSGHSVVRSIAFATLTSTTWEYLLEGWFEQPSFPDLLITPSVGSLLGEIRWVWRSRLLASPRQQVGERIAFAVLAPVHWWYLRRSRHGPGSSRA